jgi:hypothetical protein
MKTLIRSLAIISTAALWAASAYAGASRIGNAYYEDIFPVANCSNINVCSATSSSTTPSDTYLRMHHFYCRVHIANTTTIVLSDLSLQLWTAPPTAPNATQIKMVPISFSQPVASAGNNVYNIDHDILLATGPGRYVVFEALTTQVAAVTFACAISGDLIPPPAPPQ